MPLNATDETGLLHIVLVPMRYDTDGSGRLPDTSPEQLAIFENAIRAIYPMHELLLEVRDPISWTSSVRWGSFTQELRALKQSDGEDQAYYYGLIKPAETFEEYCGNSCTTGQSYLVASADSTSYRVGAGLGYSGDRRAWTLIHELGHMHGRSHAPCNVSFWSDDNSYPYGGGIVGVWGWDFRSDTLHTPDDSTDFMGYCDNLWSSDYTYLALMERMEQVHTGLQAITSSPMTTWRYIDWSETEPATWGRETAERNPSTGEWARAAFFDGNELVLESDIPLIR